MRRGCRRRGGAATGLLRGGNELWRRADNALLVLATGNAVLSGMDGKAMARNPGQVRFESLVDHNGTPTDPSDDEILETLGVVKESTGRSDDFCEASVAALG